MSGAIALTILAIKLTLVECLESTSRFSLALTLAFSMPNMTARPGCRTMEMNGGSSAPHLARTLCVPLFSTLLIGWKQKGF